MTATPATGPRTATFLLRQPRQVQGFHEPVAEGVALTMLWIPPGRFWMGSRENEPERQEREGPQHLVQVPGFFMSQTPITQGQWREVAGGQARAGESWGRELEPEPSFFQPSPHPRAVGWREGTFSLLPGEASSDQRPVENVSWQDALEFCNRLSQRTGRHYTLPSEEQWEYACRAGTTTPFHFGATITPKLVNYDGNYTYANTPKGEYRKQTAPVGMFPANAWGLQDMHGNVWEWCLDEWHETYEGAPVDGSAWLSTSESNQTATKKIENNTRSDERTRLLRGGSWHDYPWDCRSAARLHARPVSASDIVGFRVVCLPQDPSLNPSSINPSSLAVP
jgi:formylglycine-generating enzyme required for sulfatase activity